MGPIFKVTNETSDPQVVTKISVKGKVNMLDVESTNTTIVNPLTGEVINKTEANAGKNGKKGGVDLSVNAGVIQTNSSSGSKTDVVVQGKVKVSAGSSSMSIGIKAGRTIKEDNIP